MDYKKTAEEIFSGLGGKNNINDLSHCMTRIRVKLNDTSIADKEKISSAEGVITVVEKMGQFQVVIGNKVTKVYDEFIKLVPEKDISSSTIETKEKQSTINKILTAVAGIFTPTIPAIAGSGMIKGILSVLAMFYMNKYGINIKESQSYIILNALSDAIFFFMPIILGYTAAKVFKVNEIISMVIGATLCYPAFAALMTGDAAVSFLAKAEHRI